ncbi:hypothetical protein C2S53_009139 [Perilla frutescens var. hirtella]|uniref:Uncharacterized protein n=1 Tax=Perilla frutescens var. hirtella TaxID=608512 RepID=A0AAD4JCU5_PERFH|nr:hypothetical protein C2S53_009139 [Perilla frutescens var. hirtella]
MSFFQQNMVTTLSSKFDETQWVKQIRKTLDEELEEEMEIPVTIFGVPKALMMCDPDSYTPQQVAIGPYHHLRLELYDMERYKVAAAKRIQKELSHVKLETLVDHLIHHELRIRACYHRPLSFGCEALAWMTAVDVCFVFEFIRVCGIKQGKIIGKIPSGLSHLIDESGNKTTHNEILRDMMMLENQIPLFAMRMLLELQFSMETSDEMLLGMLTGLSKDLSPFKAVERSDLVSVKDCAHLLDFLYHFIVPKHEAASCGLHEIELHEGGGDDDGKKGGLEVEDSFAKPSYLNHFLSMIWEALSSLKRGPIQLMKKLIFSKPLKVFVKLPWTILGKIPIVKMIKAPIESIIHSMHRENKEKGEDGESADIEKPPLQEEITIPSVTQLAEAGVQFLPTNQGISSINFDQTTLTFYFPVINLDVNSEVVLRNLVAYEACSASGPLILARYTELMNGIIDTDVDAKYLCQKGIIVNHLKSEKEVADLWNGMSKSVRLTKVATLDKVIGDVNKFYSARWKVKMRNFMREYVFGSWKILTFLAAIAMLLIMCLQAFCQVYTCSRIVPIKALEPITTTD